MRRRLPAGVSRRILPFLTATASMAVAGTIAQTQFVLAALIAVGAPVTLADRLAMTGADLAGFAPLYAGVIAVGFLVAFSAAAFAARRLPLPRPLVFSVAGAAAIAAILVLTREVFFGVPLIAGARTMAGLLVQIGCGALAGALYAALSRRARAESHA